jgi:hypothetical protein
MDENICICRKPLKTAYGAVWEVNNKYRFGIYKPDLPKITLWVDHLRGTSHFNQKEFDVYFIDIQKQRNNLIDYILH